MDEDLFADEAESLQYPDLINRGIETAAQRRGFDLLIRSVGITEHDPGGRTLALARKSDGLILHDRVLEPGPDGPAVPAAADRHAGRVRDADHGERPR